jgi:glycerophosphoryl diester phosphodiesterase
MSGAGVGWEALPRPFAVAHRAGNDLTLARLAVDAGADLLEADIWLYRSRLELRHEKTLGPLPVLWDRWSLASGRRPRLTLDTLLDVVDRDRELMLDLKGYRGSDPAIATRIADAMRVRRPGQPYLVCSQNWRLLDAFREMPAARLAHSIGSGRQLARAWTRLSRDGHDAVSIHAKLLDAGVVAALKRRVGIVMTWPINAPDDLNRALDWGVDGVTTDRLEIARLVRALREGRAND